MIPEKAYEAAIARMKDLPDQITKARNKLAALEREYGELESFITLYHKLAGIPPLTGRETPPPVDATGPQNPKREQVAEFAEEWLRRNRRPIPRRELLQQLSYSGMSIHGQEPEKVLSTMMWRMQDRFILLKGFGYWLRSEPYALARYIPGDPDHGKTEEMFS